MDSQDTLEYQAKLDPLDILDRQVKDKLDSQVTLVKQVKLDLRDQLVIQANVDQLV
jgi:hypothetical protein